MNNHRYYICAQDYEKINCYQYLDYLEAITASNIMSEVPIQSNQIFPIYKRKNKLIFIDNWIPMFFDRAIIEWKLLRMLNVKFYVKKN